MNRWYRLDNFIAQAEQFLIIVMLSAMIIVAFLQIVLRNFFATGITWGDQFVRSLVVWVGFVGAALATKEGKHITIEVVSHWLSTQANQYVRLFSHLLSAIICGLMTLAALKFVRFEAQMGGTVFFRIPAWTTQVVIPITFGLMSFRFAFQFCIEWFTLSKPGFNPEHKKKK